MLQPGVGASCRVGAPPLPLFPSDPPLASDFPLRQLPCLPKECTGWSEGASRACVRVCALVCACLASDFIKASCPRAAEPRQPFNSVARLLAGKTGVAFVLSCPGSRGLSIPACLGALPVIPARCPGDGWPGSGRLLKMESGGGSWTLGSN